jgi:hypothetical protein
MDDVQTAGWQIQQNGAGLQFLLAQPQKVDPSRLAGDIRSALAAQGVVPPPVRVSEVMASPRTQLCKPPLITKMSF